MCEGTSFAPFYYIFTWASAQVPGASPTDVFFFNTSSYFTIARQIGYFVQCIAELFVTNLSDLLYYVCILETKSGSATVWLGYCFACTDCHELDIN